MYTSASSPTTKEVKLSLSTYNLHRVTLSVYAAGIEQLIPNTTVLNAGDDSINDVGSVGWRLRRMKLGRAIHTWSVDIKDYYTNDWRYRAVKVPALLPGVYVIQGSGGGAFQRTWFAVSSRALFTKRSPDVVKAWLVSTDGRRVIANVPLTLYNDKGRVQTVTTDADGLATFAAPNSGEALWIAAQSEEPAFARAGQPPEEKPYRVFLYTDRPIYRPGQLVHFKGTVRRGEARRV